MNPRAGTIRRPGFRVVATAIAVVASSVLSADSERRGTTFLFAAGEEAAMASLEDLIRRHESGTTPKSTIWDAWLVAPSIVRAGAEADSRRAAWRETLLSRTIDDSGHVSTHQHGSIAHPSGWPFPFWNQGAGIGWHFSFAETVGPPWRGETVSDPSEFLLEGFDPPEPDPRGIRLRVADVECSVTTPPFDVGAIDAPFVQVRIAWNGNEPARFALEWSTAAAGFDPDRSVAFAVEPGPLRHLPIELKHGDAAGDRITRFRLRALDAAPGSTLVLQAIFTQYDTRHDVNEASYLLGCATYLAWTGDDEFLAANLARMRSAIAFLSEEFGLESEHVVRNTWVGHDGRSGLVRDETGTRIRTGIGIGSNYWDLLPFGFDDAYATTYAYAALLAMAEVEDRANAMGLGAGEFDAARLRDLASRVKAEANRRFFSRETGRFVGCIDIDGDAHDYGFTFLNLEAIAFGLANDLEAQSILAWLDGDRVVEGDTAHGDDIYAFRFGPRATTRRNVDWYGWFWSAPESIPFGGQVQDGGAVFGFSYFDLMARLRVKGADDAWDRFREILAWSDDVEQAGGYRAYYASHPATSLQGCGTPGGLGVDCEFFESALVPQAWIEGFIGFRPRADGSLELDPKLPSSMTTATVTGIGFRGRVLDVTVDRVGRLVTILDRSDAGSLEVPLRLPGRAAPETFRLDAGRSISISVPDR